MVKNIVDQHVALGISISHHYGMLKMEFVKHSDPTYILYTKVIH